MCNCTSEVRANACPGMTSLIFVMPGLVPGIHVFRVNVKTWMAGT
jgi:hypothetical protein